MEAAILTRPFVATMPNRLSALKSFTLTDHRAGPRMAKTVSFVVLVVLVLLVGALFVAVMQQFLLPLFLCCCR